MAITVGSLERPQVLNDASARDVLTYTAWPVARSTVPILDAMMSRRGDAELVVGRNGDLLGISRAARCLLHLGAGGQPSQRVWSFFADPAAVQRAIAQVLERALPVDMGDVELRSRTCCADPVHLELEPLRGDGNALLGVAMRMRTEEACACDDGMVGTSAPMRRLRRQVLAVAKRNVTVLISGESGSGKEVVARALHSHSHRAAQPFHAINCAAFGEELLESELFGHERGAFTNAFRAKPGRLELCGAGTFFLDEVACLTPKMQAKLLRVLEQREFERVGGTETLRLRARVISATNAALWPLVQSGAFREDLYYRLCVVPLVVPPLRERREDIPQLIRHLLACMVEAHSAPPSLAADAEQALVAHAWPGNVRELRNTLEYALAMGDGVTIRLADLPKDIARIAARSADPGTESSRIQAALAASHYNREEAAQALGISRTTLWRRMRSLGIR